MKANNQPQSMISFNSSAKHNDIAYQYIQADIDKMNSIVMNIEQTANNLIPLVPPNLQKDISSLKERSQSISRTYSSFNNKAFKNKLKLAKESLDNLSQSILSHVNDENEFVPTKSYAETFYQDVSSRILETTKQQCSNLEFYFESELRTLANSTPTYTPFKAETPHFDTPSPKIVYQQKAPTDDNEKIILTIKDQTERLTNMYTRVNELRILKRNQQTLDENNNVNLPSLLKMQEDDNNIISELEKRFDVLDMKNKALSKPVKDKNENIKKEEILMKDQLNSFEELTNTMFKTTQKKFDEAKSLIKEEIQMIRARLEILENRINGYGDFTGESNDMMSYLGMKVEEIVNQRNKQSVNQLREDKKSEDLIKVYLDVRARITKSSIESQIEILKRSMRHYQFSQPLLTD